MKRRYPSYETGHSGNHWQAGSYRLYRIELTNALITVVAETVQQMEYTIHVSLIKYLKSNIEQ